MAYFLYLVLSMKSHEFGVSFNPYKILGVSEGMDIETISNARRKLIYEWHPDKAPIRGIDPKVAEEKFAAINKAWET